MPKNSNKDTEPKEKKRETEKDPNTPKRRLSAYMLYCADARDKAGRRAPVLPSPKILERQWKKVPHDAKTPYQAKHEVAKNQWEIDKALHEKGTRSKPLSEDADEENAGDEGFDV
ncbi:hypothetical protein BGZ82_007214 [Podila clonocystis]|nr:hypothetical protein BGZ82_007214 [Podila clonocystis]